MVANIHRFLHIIRARRPCSGNSIAFAAGREYQQPLGVRLRWRFGVDATHKEYRGNDSDQTRLSLRTCPRWLLSQHSAISLQATVGQQWVAHRRHSTDYGLRFNARYQLRRKTNMDNHGLIRYCFNRILKKFRVFIEMPSEINE